MRHDLTNFTMRDLQARIASPYIPLQDKKAAIVELQNRFDSLEPPTYNTILNHLQHGVSNV